MKAIEMKFLLDENVAKSVAQGLREADFTVFHILDIGLVGATDEKVFAFAREKKLIIITHDKDFSNLIRFPLRKHYGVIILRLSNQTPPNVIFYLRRFLAARKNIKSKLVILSEGGARIIT
ncbi:MAG: hypothetical protein A2720_03165 [Candidatus Doudnabacteria bacterium RIFCSPHIGHO2_01_FULL_46_24]|uniref:DUF5615 domain-containing protein n=2 Tax=Bacteria candidate phyla TaxID=1783234 RepID=A0A1F5NT54_9BACT|nr:MAG: hypothetical protein A2720_03165 [Candidatus Doudnabacteria bacterium RIFCSPHIGHO2_01_FULL_46_24]